MHLIRLNNAGRKFHKHTTNGGKNENNACNDAVYRNGAFWALRNIYMNISRGEIVGIIGRNGSGKSTLLNVISGALPVSEGEVIASGKISALLNLGAGFQDEFTGKENIYLNASLLGMNRHEIEKIFPDIVEYSELGEFISAPLGSYSAGMRMRLGFSIAIHKDFDVLVTDEIITVGDMSFQKKCFERMADFKRQGKSMVIATQDMALIERFCDKVFLLEDGKVSASGLPSEVIEQYRVLLNKKKLLSEGARSAMITDTKRWATDMHEWGRREGTREIIIKDVIIFNRLGQETGKVKSGEKIVIKVSFTVQEEIDSFHFGVAIFREDGVYCYGPNTQVDGLAIEPMPKGQGHFELEIEELMLMPGVYYISAAIWDKNETFAYDYHKGNYKMEISGSSANGQLLSLTVRRNNFSISKSFSAKDLPDLDLLIDKWGAGENSQLAVFGSLALLNNYEHKDSIFVTGRTLKMKIDFQVNKIIKRPLILWVGIYRSDRIYCHGRIKKITSLGTNSEVLVYPDLRLLPGGYKISLGLWDPKDAKFLFYSHGVHLFNMISDKRDHGTIYLKHCWRWEIPKGG